MLSPTLQRLAHLSSIFRTIVDARNACTVAAHVIEYCLNNVRQYSKPIGHNGRSGAAEVVEAPIGEGGLISVAS